MHLPPPSAPRPRSASPRRPALTARGPGGRPARPPLPPAASPRPAGRRRLEACRPSPLRKPGAVPAGGSQRAADFPPSAAPRGAVQARRAPRGKGPRLHFAPREGGEIERKPGVGAAKGEACQRFAWSSLFDPSSYFECLKYSVPASRFLSLSPVPNQKQLSGLFYSSVYSLPARSLLG